MVQSSYLGCCPQGPQYHLHNPCIFFCKGITYNEVKHTCIWHDIRVNLFAQYANFVLYDKLLPILFY